MRTIFKNFFWGGLHNEAFPKKNIKIKRKCFNSSSMTKSLVKSSRRNKDSMKKF